MNDIRYSLKLLPLGGSCAMLGEDSAGSGDFSTASGVELEDAEDDTEDYGILINLFLKNRKHKSDEIKNSIDSHSGSETDTPDDIEYVEDDGDIIIDYDGVLFRESEIPDKSFQGKPNWQRFIICIAGVFNNFLLAFILALFVVNYSGFDVPIVLGASEEASAYEVGFIEGDILKSISIDGSHKRNINSFRELYVYLYIHEADFNDDSIATVSYIRDGETLESSFSLYYDETTMRYRLGLSFYSGRVAAENFIELSKYAYYELRYNVGVVFDSLGLIFRGRVQRNEVMGPVGTVSVIGSTVQESAEYGLFNAFLVLLELSIMISANLGVMNLLPIPALDGGRLLFIILEMISRRRLNPIIEERINQIGMIFLLLLMALILSNDVINVITGAYSF